MIHRGVLWITKRCKGAEKKNEREVLRRKLQGGGGRRTGRRERKDECKKERARKIERSKEKTHMSKKMIKLISGIFY